MLKLPKDMNHCLRNLEVKLVQHNPHICEVLGWNNANVGEKVVITIQSTGYFT